MRIQVRKCPFTGRIFEEKDKNLYIEHLKKIREGQQEKRKNKNYRKEFRTWLINERANICSIEDIVPWFLKNQKYIMKACNNIKYSFDIDDEFSSISSITNDRFYPNDIFSDMKISAKYNPYVSNSHSCPDNGVTNWSAQNKSLPASYPGFEGSITGKLNRLPKHMSSYPYNSALNIVGIKTGTGGGGNDSWMYGVKIFLDDWPGLRQQLTFNKLKGSV